MVVDRGYWGLSYEVCNRPGHWSYGASAFEVRTPLFMIRLFKNFADWPNVGRSTSSRIEMAAIPTTRRWFKPRFDGELMYRKRGEILLSARRAAPIN